MVTKGQRPLNVSTSAVFLPNFIVIKVPETVPAPHTSVALSLPWFLSIPHPILPNTLWLHGKEETEGWSEYALSGPTLGQGGAVDQEEGFPARQRWSWRQRVEQKVKSR